MEIMKLAELMLQGLGETMYMVLVSTSIAYVIGLPLGIVLCVTDKEGIRPNRALNAVLGFIVNMLRSVPFLILLVAIMPFTRKVVGTTIGSTATIVPLIVGSAPFIARMVESSVKEVDSGVIEAVQSMGTPDFKIITKVLIPEAKPSLIMGAAIAITTILGYSALAGFTGGGGLGAIAVNYGYYRYKTDVMLVTVLLLVVIVQIFQEVGMYITRKTDKRIK
ncbi:MAG: ABC transporter permease [Eubacteriaceae bacterium]|nr:ABC transporter permease [Eubacteriaceae bacterium]MBQ1384510.1 ABC transporter permease [Bacillota bacterium]MBQ1466671.1 ABC transporter permease [Eubacteriaceae bacterium]MCR4894573.1 ABC transporter permease [Eubacteriales bacterium]